MMFGFLTKDANLSFGENSWHNLLMRLSESSCREAIVVVLCSPGRVVRVRDCASQVVGSIPTQGTSTSVLVTLNPYGIG
jgi:hypothetical protein